MENYVARLEGLASTRVLQPALLSAEECRELVALCSATACHSYRHDVQSATIHDVAATAPFLLMPLVRRAAVVTFRLLQ